MKIKKLLTILSLISLISCKNSNDIKILTPTGAPSIAFYSEINNINYETNSNANNLLAFMSSSTLYDVIVIDTIGGIKAINNNANYKIASTITFGNFYLVATDINRNTNPTNKDKICLFGKNQTPDLLFNYVYDNQFSNIEYVNNVQTAASVFKLKENIESGNKIDFVLLAEPLISSITNNENFYKININDLYYQKSSLIIPQASIFISNNANKKELNKLLKKIENNINNLINESEDIDLYFKDDNKEIVKQIYGVNKETIKKVMKTNTINIGYIESKTIKEDIDNYISLFNLGKTNEEIYY